MADNSANLSKLVSVLLQMGLNGGRPQAFVLVGPPGIGKCLARGTKVIKYDGTVVNVEDVKKGDLLMGPDSTPRTVLSTNTDRGPMYRIVPNKGDAWECNDVHMLTLVHSTDNHVVDVGLDAYLKLPSWKQEKLKLFQPEYIIFPNQGQELPITPYFLGTWLGDGTKSLEGVSITKDDEVIRQACETEATKFGLVVKTNNSKPCPTYRITAGNASGLGRNKNPLLTILQTLMQDGICVPHDYRTASMTNRLELLAGFLDTDGHYVSGCYEYVQKNKDVGDGIAFVARSVGLRVTHSIKVVNDVEYQRYHISGNIDKIPCRIERKQAEPRKINKDALRTGFVVEALTEGQYFGFTLDGDHRFLLGDFTVTHNTYGLMAICEALSTKLKRNFPAEIWSGPQIQAEDAAGLPVPDLESGTTRLLPLRLGDKVMPAGAGLLCIDEFGSLSPAQEAAFLNLLQGGTLGERTLPTSVALGAAMNPEDHASNARALSAPAANRFVWLEWNLDTATWLDYMRGGKGFGSHIVTLTKDWEAKFGPQTRGLVASYIKRNPSSLHRMPAAHQAGQAWASPRSWEAASRLMAAIMSTGERKESDLVYMAVEGCVGKGDAESFMAWMVEMNLPDPEDLLRDPANAHKLLPKRTDQKTVCLESLATAALQDRKDKVARWEKAWAICGPIFIKENDVGLPCAAMLAKSPPKGAKYPAEANKVHEILRKAGLIS